MEANPIQMMALKAAFAGKGKNKGKGPAKNKKGKAKTKGKMPPKGMPMKNGKMMGDMDEAC